MAWIESHQSLKDHPKASRLSKFLAWNLYETLGRLHAFWWWALTYAETGYIDRFSEAEIATAFGASADLAPALFKGLVECGFLDIIECDTISEQKMTMHRIHDWWDYAGHWLRSKYKRSPRKWREIRNRYVTRTQRLRNRIPNLTKPNQTKPESPISPLEFLAQLKLSPAYTGIDVDWEFYKCQEWCVTANRKLTKRTFVNWLNRIDKPITIEPKKGPYID